MTNPLQEVPDALLAADKELANYNGDNNPRKRSVVRALNKIQISLRRLDELEKPRPLRKLIAEGCEQFWVTAIPPYEDKLVWTQAKKVSEKELIFMGNKNRAKIKEFLEAPAYPIHKPPAPEVGR